MVVVVVVVVVVGLRGTLAAGGNVFIFGRAQNIFCATISRRENNLVEQDVQKYRMVSSIYCHYSSGGGTSGYQDSC